MQRKTPAVRQIVLVNFFLFIRFVSPLHLSPLRLKVMCQDALADPYGRATITCQAEGIAYGVGVTIKWFRKEGHVSIDEDDNHRIEKDKHRGTLTIFSVGKEDGGVYRCEMEGTVGETDKQDVTLNVKPHVSRMPLSERLPVGSDVRLTCPAWGYEQPNVTWYRDDQLIHDQARLRLLDDSDGKALEIVDICDDDRAVFKCTAVNRHGEHSRSTLLRVTGTLIWMWPLLVSIGLFVVAVVLIVVFDRGSRRVAQTSKNI